MRICFLRHGETDWNRDKRLQGRTEIPLNEAGRALAVSAGRGMAELRFDFCITSPLGRAQETAALILKENRVYREPENVRLLWPSGVPAVCGGFALLTDERILERNLGAWEGCYFTGPNYNLPVPFYPNPARPEGGETHDEVTARLKSFLDELTDRFGETDVSVLVISHGGVLRALDRLMRDDLDGTQPTFAQNCEAFLLEPDADAEAEQRAHGVPEGSLLWGRRLKLAERRLYRG